MANGRAELPVLGRELAPLCGHDDDKFTRDSIFSRLPAILDETARCNPSWTPAHVAAVRALGDELRSNAILSVPVAGLGWDDGAHLGQRVAAVPWFWLENYVYKRLLAICEGQGVSADPFQAQKDAALAAARSPFLRSVLPVASLCEGALRAALLRSLWGNRADLSLSAGVIAALGGGEASELLLADDSEAAVRVLEQSRGGLVAIILDNCGLELCSDLVLADTLLRTGAACTVALHVKASPVFVSDAMEKDVEAHVEGLRAWGAEELAGRLSAHLCAGTLSLQPHPFFSSPCPYWDAPDDLTVSFAPSTLVIVKGDANYRRLMGDRHWPHATPFAAATSYFPAPLLALRTCKAGVAVGVAPAAEARAAAADADWLVSGKYGLVQLGCCLQLGGHI